MLENHMVVPGFDRSAVVVRCVNPNCRNCGDEFEVELVYERDTGGGYFQPDRCHACGRELEER